MRLKFTSAALLTTALVLSSFSFAFAKPDEGMFTPDQIAKLPLKQKGLKIKASDIYNPNGADISDAIISLSIGCTAEFVSPKGLILTNHHCGFDAIVAASTPQNDYGKDGYKADSMATELPAKDYSLTITNRVEDVTAKITAGTEALTGDALAKAIKENTDKLKAAEQAKVPEGTTIAIQALNSGLFYYLYETQQLKDIRVVYAPPQMIGFYGGDPDNFEWSRHTGDFTFLRAYVGKDGKAAEYSKDNVPYQPKKFLKASLDGVKENDFVFVMGFPGGTTRYRESQFIDYSESTNFPFLVDYLTAWSNGLRIIGQNDEAKRIALQSEVASLDNSRKAFEGAVVSLRRSDFADQRRDQERKFAAWANENPQRKAKYGDVLAKLDSLSKEYFATGARDRLIRTFPNLGNAPVYSQLIDAYSAVRAGRKPDDRKREEIKRSIGEREPALELEMLKYFFRSAAKLPANQKFAAVEDIFGGLSGKARTDAENALAETIANGKDFDSADKILALYDQPQSAWESKFPQLTKLVAGHAAERAAFIPRRNKYNAEIDALRVTYERGMGEMNQKLIYPDANFTMRFTYGNVKGYQPREAVIYTPFTTLKGVLEKNTGVFPFDNPSKLAELQKSQDFGRYGVGDSVPVNFLSTNDIIGGNSGSPIMNAKGEQVGIVFDGNFEGLGNDIFFDANYNRTINVDIRYVLFVTEKFAGAKWIVDEMTLVGGGKKK